MIRYVVLLGLLSASPLTAQSADESTVPTDKLETAYAGCVWERKPELAKLLVEKGMVNQPEVVEANKEAFAACKDVYIDNATTADGDPVSMAPAGFMTKLEDLDPDRPQTLAKEMREFRANEKNGGGS
jgi:hypothetical protein